MRSILSTAILSALIWSGCYNPNPDSFTVICPAESPQCPDGKVCVAGVCVVPDAGASTDGSITDQAMPPGGCATGIAAKPLGMNAAGCPGVFSAGQARSRCGTGYAPCTAASSVNTATCNQETGFFMADQPVFWLGAMDSETCGTSIVNQLLAGCGSAGRAGTLRCGGFPKVIDLGNDVLSMNGSLDQTSNSNASYGVLCCKL